MAITQEQAQAAAVKIQDRLLRQGRGQAESIQDAARWVQDTYGQAVTLAPTGPETVNVSWASGWSVKVCYVGCECADCAAVDARKEQEWTSRQREARKQASKDKSKATRAYNKVKADGSVSYEDYDRARRAYNARINQIEQELAWILDEIVAERGRRA